MHCTDDIRCPRGSLVALRYVTSNQLLQLPRLLISSKRSQNPLQIHPTSHRPTISNQGAEDIFQNLPTSHPPWGITFDQSDPHGASPKLQQTTVVTSKVTQENPKPALNVSLSTSKEPTHVKQPNHLPKLPQGILGVVIRTSPYHASYPSQEKAILCLSLQQSTHTSAMPDAHYSTRLRGVWCVQHSTRYTTGNTPRVQCAFKIFLIHELLQFALDITFCCVLHQYGNQDIHYWKLYRLIGFTMYRLTVHSFWRVLLQGILGRRWPSETTISIKFSRYQ